MKKLTLLIFFSAICTLLSAQYEAVFNHYNLGHGSRNLINPAAAGFEGVSQLQFNLRAQWTGFEDAPKTYGALFNAPIGKSFGLGLVVYSEQAAQLNNLRLFLNYAFRFTAGEDWKISAGFSTEYQQMTLDSDVMTTPLLQQGDQLIDDFLGGKGVFDAAVGFYAAFRDNTFGGISINNLVRNRLVDISGSGSQPGQSTSALQFYTFAFGHKFDLYELNLTLEPSLVIRQVLGGPESLVDINLKAGFLEEQLIAGLSYRGGAANTLAILLGTRLSGFNLYYSYDVSFQRFQDYSVGSHEVTVAFSFENPER
ncbi:MAG: PorP/SprF family type IX secretion system membrane protein [Saprospiraceae bacterium]|nr:PorP/SprF family type IX secretion system membrane protein [Saprospiraceae bacterium]